MKRFLVVTMILGLLLGTVTVAFAAQETIRIWAWGDLKTKQAMEKMTEDFTAQYPDIKVEVEVYDFDSYMRKMPVAIASGTAPDVLSTSNENNGFASYAAMGAFADLKPFIEKDKRFMLSDYTKAALDAFTVDGKLVCLPEGANTPVVLYYNKDLFDEAGVSYPNENWTFADLEAAAKKLTKRDSSGKTVQYGYFDDQIVWFNLLPWIWQNGGDLFSKDLTKFIGDETKAREVLLADHRLLFEDGVAPDAATFTTAGVPSYEFFSTGKLAMIIDQQWVNPRFQRMNKFNWDATRLPLFKKGQDPYFLLTLGGNGIYAKSKHKDAAWKYIVWWSQNQIKLINSPNGSNVVPVQKSLQNLPGWLTSPPSVRANQLRVQVLPWGKTFPVSTKYFKALDYTYQMLSKLWVDGSGLTDPGKYLDEGAAKINAYLKTLND